MQGEHPERAHLFSSLPQDAYNTARRQPLPAKSKAQQKAAGAALAVKRGEASKSSLQGASKEMFESMTEDELVDFASTTARSTTRES